MSSDSLLLVPAKGLENPIQSDLVKCLEHLGNHKKKKDIDEMSAEFSGSETQEDQQSLLENTDVLAEERMEEEQTKPEGCCSKTQIPGQDVAEESVVNTDVKSEEVCDTGVKSEGDLPHEDKNLETEVEVDEKNTETKAKSESRPQNEETVSDPPVEVVEVTFKDEKGSEKSILNEGLVSNSEEKVYEKVCETEANTEKVSETNSDKEDIVLEVEEIFFETEPKSDELIQNEDMATEADEKICNTEEKSAIKEDISPNVDVKIDEQLSSSESESENTTVHVVNKEVHNQNTESKSEKGADNDDIMVLDVEVDDEMQISETEAIPDVEFQPEHEETEITVQIEEITEDENSGEMLKMTICFPQQSGVVYESRLGENSPFDVKSGSRELPIKDAKPEEKNVETLNRSTYQIENKSSTPEVKPVDGSPSCLDFDVHVSENLKCDTPSVLDSSQSINYSEQSPKSEISIVTLDNDEPQIEYLQTNMDSQATICSGSTPRAQSQEDLTDFGKRNSASSVEDNVDSSTNFEEVMVVDPVNAVPTENKDSSCRNLPIEKSPMESAATPETASTFEGNATDPSSCTTVINMNVNNEAMSCGTKVAERKSGVDELIRQLDETQPTHKLRSLCKRGDLDELKEFLKMKVDLNSVSDEGWTCLHEIITHECQFSNVANLLLLHGANASTQDAHGDSPLHSSLLYHCVTNTELLLKYGANVELANKSGSRPIHMANDVESLRLLLEFGADVNAVDKLGNTCLHYAVVSKDIERVKLLLKSSKYKPNVSVQNRSGATPLHLTSDPEIASLLLDSNANPNLVDLRGNSPLHLAVRGRHKELVWNLLEHKADSSIVNWDGKIPASLAKDKVMKSILAGKSKPEILTTTGGTPMASRKRPHSPVTPVASSPPPSSDKMTPGILKRQRRVSREGNEKTSRLRFSDVNDYNYVDQGSPSLERRVKARPIYSEPRFSSDDDE